MKLSHLLLTRFSYRQSPELFKSKSTDPIKHSAETIKDEVGEIFTRMDPLDPARLDFRFALFETACLPNVIGQSNQDFDWVLIVDPDLPAKYRQRLEALIAKRKRTYLHDYNGDNLGSLDWLDKYIPKDADYALTTLLDDDDIITLDFVEKIQSHVYGLGDDTPSMKLLGIKTTYEWDLYSSKKHPYGTWAPWHRTNYFRSTGYSMLCNIAMRRLSVYAVHHSLGDIWYALGSREQVDKIARDTRGLPADGPAMYRPDLLDKFQNKVNATDVAGADDWKSMPARELYYDLSDDGLFAVHLNHFVNNEATRLFEHKNDSVAIVGEDFFPNDIVIDWQAFNENKEHFALSSSRYEKFVTEIKSYKERLELGWWKSLLLLVAMRSRLTWFYLRN